MKQVKGFILLMMIFVSGFAAQAAFAENRSGAFTLTPMIGGYVFEGDQDIEDDFTYGLGLGYNLDENWGVEAVLNYVDTESEIGTGNDVDVYAYHLDALYHFMPENTLVPYLAIGLGAITADPDQGNSETDFMLNYGLGLKYFLNENTALRLDARHLMGFDQGLDESSPTDNNFVYTGGVSFLFGGAKPVVAPLDSDGDGVLDDDDRCPGTPAGVKVDSNGCPRDSDGDGVADYLDKCPRTPKGVPVDSNGCPTEGDEDGDGVPDALDMCPDTLKGEMVDEEGCPIIFTLQIEFDFDKSEIPPGYENDLKNAAQFIRDNPAPRVLVAGHTDNVGDEDYNLRLSADRAEAVRRYLIDNFGLDAEKLVARGFGEQRPIADNNTDEGRQKNRRVEIACCVVIPEEY